MSFQSLSRPHCEEEPETFKLNCEENKDGGTKTLTLNVLLLGDRQSGRSSVGNALIGGAVFNTSLRLPGTSAQTQLVSRTFPRYFRRQGEESNLCLKVVDTPPVKPRPQELRARCPEGVHVLVMIVRADQVDEETELEKNAKSLLGPEFLKHALLVLTHADRLQEAGLQPSLFLSLASDWLRALADRAGGGVLFVDSGSDWPSLVGKPIRDRVLSLSAKNHHQSMTMEPTP